MALPTLFHSRAATRWPHRADIFDRMLDNMFENLGSETLVEGYPVDIREEDGKIAVDAEMPGFHKADVDISIDDDFLSIQAERSADEAKGRPHVQERVITRVQRAFRLPCAVDPDSVEATLQDGILHMEMKKSASNRTRRIEIQ